MNNLNMSTVHKNALTTGFLYLAVIVIGLYGFVYALPQIKVDGDIAATMNNIAKSESLFRAGIFCILIMNVVSIVLALYLHKLLSPLNKSMATSMLSFLLIGAGISMLNEVNHFAALILNTNLAENVIMEQNQTLTQLFIDMHKYGSHIAVIFWGVWLFPLGGLVYKLDTKISKFIGIMVIIAGVGYVIDCIIVFLMPNNGGFIFSDYTFIGELLLTLWLLFKSKDVAQQIVHKSA